MVTAGLLITLILFVIGVPIWVALAGGSIFLLLFSIATDPQMIPISFFGGIDSFTLMACPFFLIAGNVMAYGGTSPYIYNIINSYFGRIRGGIAITTVLMSMVYAAITGSTLATLAGVSTIALPNMIKQGYSRKFCGGLLCVCATLGQMIPPSVYMIVYGTLTQQNAGQLFISGIIPGIICGGILSIIAYFRSPKLNMEFINSLDPAYFSWASRGKFLFKGFPALVMPIIVLGSIYTGVATPTEAGSFAVIYGILISILGYRSMSFKDMVKAMKESATTNSMIFMLVPASLLFAIPLTFARLPQQLGEYVASLGLSGTEVMIATTILFLILGCFLDSLPVMFLTIPILLPTLQMAGVNLIQLNVITILAMQIGQVTPPFGVSLYVTSKVVEAPMMDVLKEALPYMFALVLCLILFIFVPEISLFLPRLMMGN